METKEMSYNELVINGFMALFFNLVMLPALVFLNFFDFLGNYLGYLFLFCLCWYCCLC